jgi:hypothetical protein
VKRTQDIYRHARRTAAARHTLAWRAVTRKKSVRNPAGILTAKKKTTTAVKHHHRARYRRHR